MQTGKRTVCHILVILFAFYYANICFFYHSHIINGVTIVHSHFYSGDHATTGGAAAHSETQLTLIAALADFQTPQPVTFMALAGVFLLLIAMLTTAAIQKPVVVPIRTRSLRAPPFLH